MLPFGDATSPCATTVPAGTGVMNGAGAGGALGAAGGCDPDDGTDVGLAGGEGVAVVGVAREEVFAGVWEWPSAFAAVGAHPARATMTSAAVTAVTPLRALTGSPSLTPVNHAGTGGRRPRGTLCDF